MHDWNDTIWTVMVEKAIVHKDGQITFFSRTARKSKLRSEAVNAKYSKAVEEFDFFHRLVGVLLIYCP